MCLKIGFVWLTKKSEILDEKEATKDILDDSRDVGQRIDWL